MPNYTAVSAQQASLSQAASVQPQLRSSYEQAKAAQGHVQLYIAGADPDFNGAIDSIFTAAERATLNSMLGNLNTLITNWEADAGKRALLGLEPL